MSDSNLHNVYAIEIEPGKYRMKTTTGLTSWMPRLWYMRHACERYFAYLKRANVTRPESRIVTFRLEKSHDE